MLKLQCLCRMDLLGCIHPNDTPTLRKLSAIVAIADLRSEGFQRREVVEEFRRQLARARQVCIRGRRATSDLISDLQVRMGCSPL